MRKLRSYLPLVIQFLLIGLVVSLIACTNADRNVATQHNDKYRTGAYLAETMLTPDRVKRQGMHILYWIGPDTDFRKPPAPRLTPPCYSPVVFSNPQVDPAGLTSGGPFFTQLLYVTNVGFEKETANGLFAATLCLEINAFNADTGKREWVRDLRGVESDPCRGPRALDATPVIDVNQKKIFAVFSTQVAPFPDCVSGPPVRYFLVSISLLDGSMLNLQQIRAHDDRTGQEFSGEYQDAHPGLLLDHGSVYVAFGSYAVVEDDRRPYQGWVMRYNEGDLTLQSAFCTSCTAPTPSVHDWRNGGGVWQGGGGLAADDEGNIYFLTGNGLADFQPRPSPSQYEIVENHLYGDSMVKHTINGNKMTPSAFAPEEAGDRLSEDSTYDPVKNPLPFGCGLLCLHDADLGSGGGGWPILSQKPDLFSFCKRSVFDSQFLTCFGSRHKCQGTTLAFSP